MLRIVVAQNQILAHVHIVLKFVVVHHKLIPSDLFDLVFCLTHIRKTFLILVSLKAQGLYRYLQQLFLPLYY